MIDAVDPSGVRSPFGASVLNWVRDEARKLPEPSTKAEVAVVTLDEMWRFVKKD